jgi:hypothetical protein
MVKGIRNLIVSGFFKLSIMLVNVEKIILKKRDNGSTKKNNSETIRGLLSEYLIRGEITKEVKTLRWRMYKILGNDRKNVFKVTGYDKDGMPIIDSFSNDYKKNLLKVKIDNADDYELELVFYNDDILPTLEETIGLCDVSNVKDNDTIKKPKKPLIVYRKFITSFNIENYTKKLNVRRISDNEKMLEFYINKYSDNKKTKKLINELNTLLNIENQNENLIYKFNSLDVDSVEFVSDKTIGCDDLLLFKYNIQKIDKIIEFDGYYVIKYIANVEINGESVVKKFEDIELESKYERKEKKWINR